jgi:hypothetical protein
VTTFHLMLALADEDAPESCSLFKSKRSSQHRDHVLTEFHAKEKAKKKERNRQRDKKWKERSGKVLDVEDEVVRAMRAVREEMYEDDDSGRDSELDERSDIGSSGKDENEGSDSGHSEDFGSIEDEDMELPSDGDDHRDQPDPPTMANRLPDHLFTSAFTARSSPSNALPKVKTVSSARTRKRNVRTRTSKDMVLGWVYLRFLPL